MPQFDVEQLPRILVDWRERFSERAARHELIDEVVAGSIEVLNQEGEPLDNYSANFIQLAMEDTAEASSLLPSIRVGPSDVGERAKKKASGMEFISEGYMEVAESDRLIPESVLEASAYGLMAWTIMPDKDLRMPRIEKRDARTCYPEPGYRPGDPVRRCLFARYVYLDQLPNDYQAKIVEAVTMAEGGDPDFFSDYRNIKITLVEWFDDHEYVIAAVYESIGNRAGDVGALTEVQQLPVELDRWENPTGTCPVVIESRLTLGEEHRGQFDQAIDILRGHVRLFSVMMDYADQSVYSDIWVRDPIGDIPLGGGSLIELGVNGDIGRVPPAVSSFDVQRDLERLVDGIHMASKWPKTRPGEVDQSQASGAFVETTIGTLNTAIRTYHQMLQRAFAKAIRMCFLWDKAVFPGEKMARGILRNQTFIHKYDPSADIDEMAKINVDYGIGFGKDPAQSAVIHTQYAAQGLLSKESVMSNIDGITDVSTELARIDIQELEGMAKKKLLMMIEQGAITDRALVEIARGREKGKSIWELFEEFVVEPKEDQEEAALPSALGGGLPPGMGPGQEVGPDGQPIAGPGGEMAPPAPPAQDLLSRINVPAGPGGTLGAQVVG